MMPPNRFHDQTNLGHHRGFQSLYGHFASRIFIVGLRCGVVALALVAFWLNARLYLAPATQSDFDKIPRYAVPHLAWIREALVDGAAEEMQRLFPEGFFFSHVLYGLAWVEMGLRSVEHRDEAVREARWSLAHIASAAGKAAFPPDLPPGHGMFYSGWRNHLQAGIALLTKDKRELDQLRSRSDALVQALTSSAAWPWLASYHNMVWPCDAPPGIHAMCVYDEVTGEDRYADFVTRWISAVARNLDSEYQMIPHIADPVSGLPLSPPRGTSQTIILRFLADIDSEFASVQYRRFQVHFQHSVFGIPSVLEYPSGTKGPGDVDSGPLIAGVSASATVVGMGVAQIYGNYEISRAMSQFSEAIGFPLGIDKRRYLGGVLPVGDAFVVHATTARLWLRKKSDFTVQCKPVSKCWRGGIHLLSILVTVVLVFVWRLSGLARRQSDQKNQSFR